MTTKPWISIVIVLLMGSIVFAQTPATPAQAKSSATPAIPYAKTMKEMAAPTLVTFQCKNVSRREAIAQLSKVIGVPLDGETDAAFNLDEGSITCDFTKQPFWKVVQSVCEQGGFQVGPSAENRASFGLGPRTAKAGKVLQFPTKVESSVVPVLAGWHKLELQDGTVEWVAVIRLLAEPKVMTLAAKPGLTATQAIDSQGYSLTAPPLYKVRSDTFDPVAWTLRWDNRLLQQELPLKAPAPSTTTFKKIAGSMRVAFGFDVHAFDVSDVISGKLVSVPFGKGSIVFSDFKTLSNETIDNFLLTVSAPNVDLPGGGKWKDSAGYRGSRVTLIDAEGRRSQAIEALTLATDEADKGRMVSKLKFLPPIDASRPGPRVMFIEHWKPVRATFESAGHSEEMTIPFEFDDVPVPPKSPT